MQVIVRFLLSLILVVGCGFLATNVFAQSKRQDKDNISIRAVNASAEEILYHLSKSTGMIFSFEQSTVDGTRYRKADDGYSIDDSERVEDGSLLDSELKPVTKRGVNFLELQHYRVNLDFKNASLESVLTKLVSQLDNYEWKWSQGVVNIYPTKGRDDRISKLLELKVKRFNFSREQKGRWLTQSLITLPEVRQFLKENSLSYSGGRLGPDSGSTPLGIDFEFENLTVGEILNRIAFASGRYWLIKWENPKNGVDQLFIQN